MKFDEIFNKNILNSPWLTIWFKPRMTIRKLIANEQDYMLHLILILGSFSAILFQVSNKNIADKVGNEATLLLIVIMSFLFGIFYAYFQYFLISEILKRIGGFFGGKAALGDIQKAIAWSYIPNIISLLFWMPILFIYGKEFFSAQINIINSNFILLILYLIFSIILSILSFWSNFIYIKFIAEAHQFSFWKSLMCVVVSFVFIFVPIVFCVLCFYLL